MNAITHNREETHKKKQNKTKILNLFLKNLGNNASQKFQGNLGCTNLLLTFCM